ncbi:apolipoprotein Bb, tandem duplicate 1 [Brachyhypopomus gauderio]|uniref:apolipoprotein Bb, tandem duplicate 1 n=1 Tax=Brachyhypopomus gauderio TaxID=698409 RepID=UPI0040423C41
MGDTKLLLLLLMATIVLSNAQDDDDSPCLLATRYKNLHKYEYIYETESLNALNGAVNGPRASCKVELEVRGTCSYIVRTKECTLSEVIDTEADGSPVFGPAAGTETFKTEMEKNPLKVTVEGDDDIKLFPEDNELINILNIKRGIVSALAVPVLEEERNDRMPTIYGVCETDYTVNTRQDIATDITISRDLSSCDHFRPIQDHTSPLALITGLHNPLAQLIRSKQTCNYKFDNQQKHMISGACTENHEFLPFSHKGFGITNVGKQKLSLLGVTKHNERVFDHNEANMKPLHLDAIVDMSPTQDPAAPLDILKELSGLSKTTNGHKRAHLAHRLVSVIRRMNADTLSDMWSEAVRISPSLTFQALIQCGTPECNSLILRGLRDTGSVTMEIDAAVYAMGLIPNPSRSLVKELLITAKFKPSKLIYYATSNAVRSLYKAEGRVTPEIEAVANYVLDEIDDCTDNQEHIFLTLRVIGNMAAAMSSASPALMSAVIQCINQPAASPEVQQAAIQVFRQIPVPEEGRSVLMKVLVDGKASVQKRVAAYLIIMKDPQPSELSQLAAALPIEDDLQTKNFIVSHLTNILSSTATETQELRQKILDAFQGNEVGNILDIITLSRNYKIGPLQGNMIFENELPKEAMLEMTLSAFGYDFDMFEVGMESKQLEPTVEALFDDDGFFPDTVMKIIYYASDKMPTQVNEVLHRMIPTLSNNRKKRQASQNLIEDIAENVKKLIEDLKLRDSPEAMFYLRLLGAELGYLKTQDMQETAHSVMKMFENLLKMFPTDFIKNLVSSADNELFLHYIFMDNEFYLTTGPGVPLKVALSGTFTPGINGGLRVLHNSGEIAFMPSAGVEFVTEIGAHLPDYVDSSLEIHTNMYHESGLRAEVSMTHSQIKLTIPAIEGPSKLISVTNSLVSVAGAQMKTIPALGESVDIEKCALLIPGLKYCSTLVYSDARLNDASPYFPLTGDSKLAIELRPDGEISEYTATIKYTHEKKIDKVTAEVKAEGTPFEATAMMMFNRQTYTVSADIVIPDYDIEAGIRIGDADPSTKNKDEPAIQIDLLNKNVIQASLIGRAKVKAMKDAMLQVQMLIPSLQTDAKVTAVLNRAEDMTVKLKSDFKFLEISSVQKLTLKYDDEKIEAEIKSDVSSGTESIATRLNAMKTQFSELLDQHIVQTEKIQDMWTASVEATNTYLEACKIPFLENIRVPDFTELNVPEKLFLNIEADAEYHFANQYYTITFPVPLGGKSSRDLNFPSALTTPKLTVPELGLEVASIKIPIPEVSVPDTLTVSLPVLGMAEMTGKLSSNLYNLEATASAGREAEHQRYSAKVEVTGTSPLELLSLRIKGSGLITETSHDTLMVELSSAINHKFINATLNIAEEIITVKKISIYSISKMEVTTPCDAKFSLEHTGQVGVNTKEFSGDSNLKGSLVTGPIHGTATITQSIILLPFKPEARIHSSLNVDSSPLQAQNTFTATLVNREILVQSNTVAFEDRFTHIAEATFMESKFAAKSNTKALALGWQIQNTAGISFEAGDVNIKIETTTSHANTPPPHQDFMKSLITATLDGNGLVVNSNASGKLIDFKANHNASLTLNRNGLTTTGFTSLNSPLTLKNTFSGNLDSSKASLSVDTEGGFAGVRFGNANSMSASVSSVALTSKSDVTFAKDLWYRFDISVQAEPYTANVIINNDLKILPVRLNSESEFKAGPYKVDLMGTLKFESGTEELKHTYEITYAELVATAKCNTNGKLLGTQMSHNSEMEISGLSARISNEARFNSRPVRFSTILEATAAPLSFKMHALANGDGELYLYGQQSAQVYTKVLLKAEPLAFAHSHECRVSTTHELSSGANIETNFDNKVDTLLTPSEQSTTVRVKSKINSFVINQEVSAYNNQQKIGLEMSASNDNKEYSLSAFVKYDKNAKNHVINLPLIESVPVILDNIRSTLVNIAEILQNYIKKEDFINKIETLIQRFSDFVTELNLEERVARFKEDLITFIQDCGINVEDLEASMIKLRTLTHTIMNEVGTHATELEEIVKEMINSGTLSDRTVQKLTNELKALNEKYDISGMIISIIEAIEDVIKQINMINMKESSMAFLYDLDEQYAIKTKLEQFVSELKQMAANFDEDKFVEDMKNFIISVNIHSYTEHLIANFPSEEMSKVLDTLNQLITELDVIDKCKIICSNVREILLKYEVDKRIKAFLDKIVDLIKMFKIDETVQVLANTLKSIMIPFTNMIDDAITYLKSNEVKQLVEDLNENLEMLIKRIKLFNYNVFVDEANQKISECTAEINKLIVSLELPQKLEATREFINYALSSTFSLFEELGTIKVTDIISPLKNIIDVILNNIKEFAKTFKEKVTNMDIKEEILSFFTDAFNDIAEVAKKLLGDQQIFTELKQIFEGVVNGLKTAEAEFPSFTVPLTDLVIPSTKFSLHQLQETEFPKEVYVPQFTILGYYTVPAVTITCADIKQKIIDIIDFIINLETEMFYNNAYFEELSKYNLPNLSFITLPEITFPEISFPSIPKLSDTHFLDIHLEIPEITLPKIPTAVVVPAFGKFYTEINLRCPIYTLKTSTEVQNSTDNEQMHQFTAFITSVGKSPSFDILNYNLDSSARIGIPRLSRVVIAETLKFIHSTLTVEHQASVAFYGLSAQTTAQTIVKATTTPYKADIVNKAFFAIESGMTASLDTSYKHQVNIPFLSLTSEAALTHSTVAFQKGTNIKLTVANVGTGKYTLLDYSDEGTHKSEVNVAMDFKSVKLTFTSNTDSAILKCKETLKVEGVFPSYIEFHGRIDTKAPFIKNSRVVASGSAHLLDMKADVHANHTTELKGLLSGNILNSIDAIASPTEITVQFKNKGNAKVILQESQSAQIDLQNDYAVILNTKKQHINSMADVHINQHKYSYNFTIDHNKAEAGIYTAVKGETDLEFLTVPISTPEVVLPVINFKIPAVNEFNFYEHTHLKNLLTTTKPSIEIGAKTVYQKSNLISELSFKSPIFNLNTYSRISGDDDLFIRIAATSVSMIKALNGRLEGTSSLTSKRGLKLATALYLENAHIEGTHKSSIILNTDNLETAVAVTTVAKLNLPILTFDVNHNLLADTKTQPNAASTLTVKHTFDLPIIKAVGSGNIEHTLKLSGAIFIGAFISLESTTNAKIDGTLLETGTVKGGLDNDATIYMDGEGVRSKLKTVGDINVNHGDLKLQFDVDENLDLEAALYRVYSVLSIVSNNEVNVAAFNTKGVHVAKATTDLDLMGSLAADVEFDLSQPSTLGKLSVYEKTVVDLSFSKQKISYISKIVSPVYTTSIAVNATGNAFKIEFKSSAKPPILLLNYSLDSYISTEMEKRLQTTAKAFLEHDDFKLEVINVIASSNPIHSLNVSIISPTFTDLHLRYSARMDGFRVSVSTPSTGFLGFLLYKIPSEFKANLYGSYPSSPGEYVDFFILRLRNEDETFHTYFRDEAPSELIRGLQERIPAITSAIANFADKYGILSAIKEVRTAIVHAVSEAYTAASNHSPDLSQLSILYRNVIVQYLKAIQTLLNAAVKFLRETQIKLPGMDAATVPEISQKLRMNIVMVIEQIMKAINENLDAYSDTIGSVHFNLPRFHVITAEEIFNYTLNIAVDFTKHMDSIDVVLEKLSHTLQKAVEKAQEFVDSIQSDIIDTALVYINTYYTNIITLIKNWIEKIDAMLTIDELNANAEFVLDLIHGK